MKPREKALIGFVALLIAAVSVNALQTRKTAQPFPEGSNAQAQPLQSQESGDPKLLMRAIPKRVPRQISPVPLAPDSVLSPGEIVAARSQAADAGDPAALGEIAAALHACATADMGNDEQMRARIDAKLANDQRILQGTGQQLDVDGMSRKLLSQRQQIRESCRDFSSRKTNDWLSAMEKAAAAGNSAAREQYYKDALGEMSERDRSDFPDEYHRRRSFAFDYLSDELSDGNCSSQVLEGLLDTGSDLATSYVYSSILLQQGLIAARSAGGNGAEQDALKRALQGPGSL
jgi:hypothetical protein